MLQVGCYVPKDYDYLQQASEPFLCKHYVDHVLLAAWCITGYHTFNI